jgi:monomeric isocitrate dehydrogenase
MPPLIRDGGKMWNKNDALEDTKALIPDRSYAVIYQAIVDDCRKVLLGSWAENNLVCVFNLFSANHSTVNLTTPPWAALLT